MFKVKVFKSNSSNTQEELESTLQDWFNANPHVEIFHSVQSQDSEGHVVITLLYK